MLGPLPPLYRVVVAAVTVVLGIAGGLWAVAVVPAVRPAYEVLVSTGAALGLTAGLLAAYVLLHDPHDRDRTRHR